MSLDKPDILGRLRASALKVHLFCTVRCRLLCGVEVQIGCATAEVLHLPLQRACLHRLRLVVCRVEPDGAKNRTNGTMKCKRERQL